jgi:hypothetical protein
VLLVFLILIKKVVDYKMSLYGPNGSFEKVNVPQNYYQGSQESLLYRENNPTFVGGFASYNLPSPYKHPRQNYGLGPYKQNLGNEINSAPNGTFDKRPFLRQPTVNNPFMNVSPVDYDAPPLFSNYVHYEKNISKNDLAVRDAVKNNFEKGLVQNADSLFWNRRNSQRQYVSQPVGSVPSDQAEFANWLYGTPGNCKQGSVFVNYGVEYTEDSLLCNGFNVAEPTNKGLLNGNLMSSVYGGGKGQ